MRKIHPKPKDRGDTCSVQEQLDPIVPVSDQIAQNGTTISAQCFATNALLQLILVSEVHGQMAGGWCL